MAGDALLALSVLQSVAQHAAPMTVGEVVEATGAPRSSIYRILRDLTSAGWLESEGSPRRYTNGWRSVEFGVASLSGNVAREKVLPHAIELARATGGPCAVSFYDRGEVIWTDSIRVLGSRVTLALRAERAPAASVASGKILLAHQPQSEILRVAALGLPKFTPNTNTTPGEILADIAATLERGYGLSDQEFRPWRVAGIAFPVFESSGRVVAALSSATRGDNFREFVARYREPLRHATSLASSDLGFRAEFAEVVA